MKSLNLGVALMTGALLLTVGCTPATPTTPDVEGDVPTGESPTAVEPTPSKADVGRVTDDVWVEIAAQELYHGNKDPDVWIAAGGGREKLLTRYGVTEEQLTAFGESVNSDTARAQTLIGRMAERLQELEGGK
ncbi:MAG: hypothetical protein WCS85_03970 [Candidatus Peribacteraceae bacterium]